MSEPAKYQTLQALWALRDDRTMSAAEVRVLTMLVAHANEQGQCWPSTATLAEETRMRKRAVRDAVAQLEKRTGPILLSVTRRVTEKGNSDSHMYTLSPGGGWGDREPTLGRSGPQGVGAKSPQGGVIGNHKEDSKKIVEEDNEETAVFDCWTSMLWLKVHGKGEPPKTKTRMQHIRARLRDGFSVEQLSKVIANVASTPFYLGENDRGMPHIEPKTIFKSREKVEELLAVRPRLAKAGASVQRGGWQRTERSALELEIDAEAAST